VAVSAVSREGLDELAAMVAGRRREQCVKLRIHAPAGSGKLQAYARAHASIDRESFDADGWTAELYAPQTMVDKLSSLCRQATIERIEA